MRAQTRTRHASLTLLHGFRHATIVFPRRVRLWSRRRVRSCLRGSVCLWSATVATAHVPAGRCDGDRLYMYLLPGAVQASNVATCTCISNCR